MSTQNPPASGQPSSTVTFKGKSGERYAFQALPFDTRLKAVGGVYVVTRRAYEDRTFPTKASHHVLAVGQTPDLAAAFLSKAERTKLAGQGANCICLHALPDEERRLAIEKDLVEGTGDLLHYLFRATP